MQRVTKESSSTSMNPEAWTQEDDFILHLYSPTNPLMRGFEGLESVLELVESLAEPLRQDRMYLTTRPQKYSRRTLRERFHENLIGTGTSTILTRSQPPKVSVWLDTFEAQDDDVRFSLKLRLNPFSYVRQSGHASALTDQFLTLARNLAVLLPLSYGVGHSFTDLTMSHEPDRERVHAPRHITAAYWLNVYGPRLVEELGKERVLATPASHREELPGGAVLWLTRPTPVDFDSEEARAAQARALVHLRPELRLETTLATLRERSQVFVPIPIQFHPDVSEILAKEVEFRGLVRKRQEVERFNRYQPPPVSEWLPSPQSLSSDVKDVKRAVDDYEGLLAEQLIAQFHKKVPEVLRTTPEALPALDWQLWHFGWGEDPSADTKELLIPALGAWLGRYLVHQLGGRWLPRRELMETAVIIRNRAWLPFLRARRALQSREAPLDFSCTQLFREAQRHASAHAS